jgi:hypothetical protein
MSGAEQSTDTRASMRVLVIVERDSTCSVCGYPIYAGTEAARWHGLQLAHVACADHGGSLAPRGGH